MLNANVHANMEKHIGITMSNHGKKRGKLTVYLGAIAGVGKTYMMLESGWENVREGIDVVVGRVETHGRADTEKLVEGLQCIPPKNIDYQGKASPEMDLDAILRRHPRLVLVENMAHVNVPGARHRKRFQDIEELLADGIDVYTTLNVQHIESLSDMVSKITGVPVTETVPDQVLKDAQIQLVDVPVDDLMERLQEGKVFLPEHFAVVKDELFKPENIASLRELALRYTAKQVEQQLEKYMHDNDLRSSGGVSEKIVVCIDANPFSAFLIRSGKRMSEAMRSELYVINVEPPRVVLENDIRARSLDRNIRLAEELGAKFYRLVGDDRAGEILKFCREHAISQVIIGKNPHSGWKDRLGLSLVNKLIKKSAGISVHVHSEEPREQVKKNISGFLKFKEKYPVFLYIKTLAVTLALSGFLWPIKEEINIVNVALLFVLPILYAAIKGGKQTAIFAAVVAFMCFDFIFVPPYYTFRVGDLKYVFCLIVFLLLGIILGNTREKLRRQINYIARREKRISVLYELSWEIAEEEDAEKALQIIVDRMGSSFEAEIMLLMPDENDVLSIRGCTFGAHGLFFDPYEMEVSEWVYRHGSPAGKGTDTMSKAAALHLPLENDTGIIGVLLYSSDKNKEEFMDVEERQLLDALTGLITSTATRLQLAEQAQEARYLEETEKLQTALLSSLTHDLSTPLASIIGGVTALLEDSEESIYDADGRKEMLSTIYNGAHRMKRLVNNLLGMSKIESNVAKLRKEWCKISEIADISIGNMNETLFMRDIIKDYENLPMIRVDFVLMEQVFGNLLDNAAKYADPETPIIIKGWAEENWMYISVHNNGELIPDENLEKIFDKFYRLHSPKQVSGSGLGLSICRGIITAHGGEIWVENTSDGVDLIFRLPLENISQSDRYMPSEEE